MHAHGHHHRLKRHSKRKPPVWLDKMIVVIAILGPLTTLPQIYEIWYMKNAAGVSVLSWSLFLISALIWLAYSFSVRNKPLIINNFLWATMQAAVLLGAYVY